MTQRALISLSLPALFAALAITAPAAAQDTECQPGDLFCAELRLGPGRAGIRIGGDPAPQPPPPPVVVQPPNVFIQPRGPQPPTVIYEAPPPPPPVYQPQPPVVYVQPAPPPPVVVQQAPVYVPQYAPAPQYVPVPQYAPEQLPSSSVGLNLHLGGLFSDRMAIGGVSGAFRLRPDPHVALDLGAGIYGGTDYNELDRVEVPVQADLIVFFNPQHRFQFYGLIGAGVSFSHAEGVNRFTGARESRDYAHVGGELGLGVEWRLSPEFALNLDARGFIRQRVDENPEPEFVEGSQSTDTSGGVVGRFGATFYFNE
jgi:hypothetical protein